MRLRRRERGNQSAQRRLQSSARTTRISPEPDEPQGRAGS